MDELETPSARTVLARDRRKSENLHTGSRTHGSLSNLRHSTHSTRHRHLYHNIRHRSSFLLPVGVRCVLAGCNPALCTTPEDACWDRARWTDATGYHTTVGPLFESERMETV